MASSGVASVEIVKSEIFIAAYEWWVARRPPHWDEARHITNPWVNCGSPEERNLARAVGAYAARRRMPERPTERGLQRPDTEH